MTITLQPSDFEQGTFNNGNPSPTTNRIRTIDFIPIANGTCSISVVAYTTDVPLYTTLLYYDSSKNYIGIANDYLQWNGYPFVVTDTSIAYVKLLIRRSDWGTITTADLSYCEFYYNWWQLDLSTADKDIHTDDAPSIPYALDAPYPDICWYLNNAGNDIINNAYRECEYAFKHPFPYIIWYVNDSEDDVIHDGTPVIEEMGAGMHAVNLNTLKIPKTVTSIGRYSFTHSNISTVQIASDCTYETTSFPEGCTVTFYPT